MVSFCPSMIWYSSSAWVQAQEAQSVANQAQTLPSQASSLDYNTSASHERGFARNNLLRCRMSSSGSSIPFQPLPTRLEHSSLFWWAPPAHPKLLPYSLCSSGPRSDSGLYDLAFVMFLEQISIRNSIHSAFPVTTEDRNRLGLFNPA